MWWNVEYVNHVTSSSRSHPLMDCSVYVSESFCCAMPKRWDPTSSSDDGDSSDDGGSSSTSEMEELDLTASQLEYLECGLDFLKRNNLRDWLRDWGCRPFNYASDCFLAPRIHRCQIELRADQTFLLFSFTSGFPKFSKVQGSRRLLWAFKWSLMRAARRTVSITSWGLTIFLC